MPLAKLAVAQRVKSARSEDPDGGIRIVNLETCAIQKEQSMDIDNTNHNLDYINNMDHTDYVNYVNKNLWSRQPLKCGRI